MRCERSGPKGNGVVGTSEVRWWGMNSALASKSRAAGSDSSSSVSNMTSQGGSMPARSHSARQIGDGAPGVREEVRTVHGE